MSLFNVDMMLYVLSYSKLEMLMMSIGLGVSIAHHMKETKVKQSPCWLPHHCRDDLVK